MKKVIEQSQLDIIVDEFGLENVLIYRSELPINNNGRTITIRFDEHGNNPNYTPTNPEKSTSSH